MRHTLLLVLISLSTLTTTAQEDPVVMRIGDSEVRLSEFVYAYHKNYPGESQREKKSLRKFADNYLDFRLKVKAALEAGLDTALNDRSWHGTAGSRPLMVSAPVASQVEKEARSLYDTARKKVENSGGLVKVAHILLALPQHASESQRREIQREADSIYLAIKAGADFGEMARRFSDDKATAQKRGELPWLSNGQIVERFEREAFSLKVGEVSRPFLSEFGYHIILLKDKRPFYPYEERRKELCHYVESRLLREGVAMDGRARSFPEDLVDTSIVTVTENTPTTDMPPASSPLDKEFRDAILAYEITDKTIWEQASHDENALARYFKRHKKDYRWERPRFCGVAFYVKTYEDAKKARQLLKGKPAAQWKDILERAFNNDSVVRIKVDAGLFLPGDHPLVDRDIYKKAVRPSPYPGLHIGSTYGKLSRKGPDDYTQVRSLVLADYQEYLERKWVDNLRELYRPEIYWDELTKAL